MMKFLILVESPMFVLSIVFAWPVVGWLVLVECGWMVLVKALRIPDRGSITWKYASQK